MRARLQERPLDELLPQLMAERSLTYRALAERTRAVDPERSGLTHGYLASIGRRTDWPSRAALRLLAAALELEPEVFVEYRLLGMRERLDPRIVGFVEACGLLHRIEDNDH